MFEYATVLNYIYTIFRLYLNYIKVYLNYINIS